MKYKIPDNFMGIPIEGAMERALSQKGNTQVQSNIQQTHNNIDKFIYVPDINLYVAKETAYHNLNWKQTHEELHKNNQRMLILPEFLVFLKYLITNQNNQELEKIYNEIVEVRNPWRAEWLDTDFKFKNNQLYINSNHIIDANGNLMPRSSEILEPCLMQDKLPGIDLEYWINNHTKQGLPLENTPAGSLYYWLPRSENNSVAGFDAYSDWADLVCSRNPTNSNASLGVRFVRSASR